MYIIIYNEQTSSICVCSYVYSYHLHCGIDHVQPKVCSVNVSQKLEWPEFLSLPKAKVSSIIVMKIITIKKIVTLQMYAGVLLYTLRSVAWIND